MAMQHCSLAVATLIATTFLGLGCHLYCLYCSSEFWSPVNQNHRFSFVFWFRRCVLVYACLSFGLGLGSKLSLNSPNQLKIIPRPQLMPKAQLVKDLTDNYGFWVRFSGHIVIPVYIGDDRTDEDAFKVWIWAVFNVVMTIWLSWNDICMYL